MFTDVSQDEEKCFEAHCRFMVNDEFHWFFLSCKAVYAEYGRPVRFEGTMCDVSTYLETAGDDLVYNEFRKKHNIKLSELKKGAPTILQAYSARLPSRNSIRQYLMKTVS